MHCHGPVCVAPVFLLLAAFSVPCAGLHPAGLFRPLQASQPLEFVPNCIVIPCLAELSQAQATVALLSFERQGGLFVAPLAGASINANAPSLSSSSHSSWPPIGWAEFCRTSLLRFATVWRRCPVGLLPLLEGAATGL